MDINALVGVFHYLILLVLGAIPHFVRCCNILQKEQVMEGIAYLVFAAWSVCVAVDAALPTS